MIYFRDASHRKRTAPSLANNNDRIFHNETYDGAENPIHYKLIYQGDFVCDFDGIRMYPFGINGCYFRIYLRKTCLNMRLSLMEEDLLII